MKKGIFLASFAAMTMGVCVAGNVSALDINNIASESDLRDCVAISGVTCKIGSDIDLTDSIDIEANVDVALDLNGKKITSSSAFTSPHDYMFGVKRGGVLTIKDGLGGGEIDGSKQVVALKLTIKDEPAEGDPAKLIVNGGHIIGKDYAISGNGGRQNTEVTINGGTLESLAEDGQGIYQPQYGTLTINDGTIIGKGAGIALKSGKLTMSGGTVRCTGADSTPTDGYSNGAKASGAAIQIESNSVYAGAMDLNIAGGNLISENGVALYEYLDVSVTEPLIEKIAISGGYFQAANNKKALMVSQAFENKYQHYITGGRFVGELPKDALAEGLVLDEQGAVVLPKQATEEVKEGGIGAPNTGASQADTSGAVSSILLASAVSTMAGLGFVAVRKLAKK